MGIEAFLIASAVDCVVAQRLARKLCTNCKRRTIMPQQALTEAGIARRRDRGRRAGRLRALQPERLQGRVGLYSVMRLSERIKEMAIGQAAEAEIGAAAREEGMLTLREDGVAKVRGGPDQPRGGPPCHRLSARGYSLSGIEESAGGTI